MVLTGTILLLICKIFKLFLKKRYTDSLANYIFHFFIQNQESHLTCHAETKVKSSI
jgi:hypothetical protein